MFYQVCRQEPGRKSASWSHITVMTDIVDKKTRSRMMSGIRGKNTKPEMLLRKALHAAGYRYRVNVRSLPGSPDIVLRKWNVAVQVHGCYWHRHAGCPKATMPSSNVEFWRGKFSANVARDSRALEELHQLGWRTAIVWECAIGKQADQALIEEVIDFIRSGRRHLEFG
ncbi:very short patch repair endonuclease [Pseudooceanicola sp.]|uniref:very short patch repair endonuclease n=2 Tax=Pseudooceanicola sp. TaxID=1914328 RepID=UPI003516163C